MMTETTLLMTDAELRNELRVARSTVQDQIRAELPIVKIGRAVRYRRADVLDYIERHCISPTGDEGSAY